MKNLPEKLNSFMNMMNSIDDRQERMNLLIDYAEKFKEVPADIASRPFPGDKAVPFCESEAYVFSKENSNNTIDFYFAVDNPQGISAKALCAIFQETLNDVSPEDLIKIPEDIVLEIFGNELSMGKNMGLTGILKMMQRDAKNFIKSTSGISL